MKFIATINTGSGAVTVPTDSPDRRGAFINVLSHCISSNIQPHGITLEVAADPSAKIEQLKAEIATCKSSIAHQRETLAHCDTYEGRSRASEQIKRSVAHCNNLEMELAFLTGEKV